MGSQRQVLSQKSSHCVFIEVHRQPQFSCQAGTVAESSLTPSVALLMYPRGTTHSIVRLMNLQGHRNYAGESRPGYLICSSAIGMSGECRSVAFMSIKPLFGFQFLRDCPGFYQIRSLMIMILCEVFNI